METMFSVRHLTLKLRSQSLNEEPHFIEKSDPDRDSGTESDDELAIDERIVRMEQPTVGPTERRLAARERTRSDSGKENAAGCWRNQRNRSLARYTESVMASTLAAVAALSASDDAPHRASSSAAALAAPSPVEFNVTDSALPSDSDHAPCGDQHSSEEELECINETAMMTAATDGDAGVVRAMASRAGGRASAVRFGPGAFGPGAFGPPGDGDGGDGGGKSPVDHRQKRSASNPQQGPEKRKWDRVHTRRSAASAEWTRAVRTRPRSAVLGVHHPHQQQQQQQASESASNGPAIDCCSSASSDDEVQSLVGSSASPKSPLPVQFRTSPPEGAHRPTRSLSPPPKFFLAEDEDDADEEDDGDDDGNGHADADAGAGESANSAVATDAPVATATAPIKTGPRKRHRHHLHRSSHHQKQPIQRPCLDFEKMQQMKNRSLSTWRHDGELSLFCW